MIYTPLWLHLLFSVTVAQKPSIWGFSTSAVQIEGAWNVSKGVDVWDTFTHRPDAPARFGNKDIAADHYHRFKEDFALMKSISARAYRFSFAWARILPNCTGPVNPDGIKYYHELIDTVIASGAVPIGTMYHWDLPQVCQDRYGGWTNKSIVADFVNYALVLADNFSDKITFWLTVNEPSPICYFGYSNGFFAPGVQLGPAGEYSCAYHSMMAHASAVNAIRKKYPNKGLQFSLPIVLGWAEPLNPSNQADIDAAIRSLEYSASWYLDPLFLGDYPASMISDPVINSYMPRFTDSDKSLLKGSMDFLSFNYYTSSYVYYDSSNGTKGHFNFANQKNGQPIGAQAGIEWQSVVPSGLRKLMGWLANRYRNTDMWITEIGYAGPNEANMTKDEIVNDSGRIQFLQSHLDSMMDGILLDKVPLKAVLLWSLLDNWEWQYGYLPRFGTIAVDYKNQTLERSVKASGRWLSDYFANAPPLPPSMVPKNTLPTSPASPTPQRNSANHAHLSSCWAVLFVSVFTHVIVKLG